MECPSCGKELKKKWELDDGITQECMACDYTLYATPKGFRELEDNEDGVSEIQNEE